MGLRDGATLEDGVGLPLSVPDGSLTGITIEAAVENRPE